MSVIFFQYEKRAHACFGKKPIYDVLIYFEPKQFQPADTILEFPDILLQSFLVHQLRFFHKFCKPF